MKNVLSYVILGLFLIQGLLFLSPARENVLIDENRLIKTFPKTLRFTQKGIKKFFSDLDAFFADRMLLRKQAIEAVAGLNEALEDYSDSFKVLQGRDGWLFLGNYTPGNLSKLTGLTPPVKRSQSAEKFRRGLAPYSHLPRFFILAPNKSSVYPEKLPGYINPAPLRYSIAILPYLEQAGLVVYDPSDLLMNSKNRGRLYYRTDTHWNSLGAAVAAEGFLECYKRTRPGNDDLELPSHNFSSGPVYKGDLLKIANMRDDSVPDGADDNYILNWLDKPPHLSVLSLSDGGEPASLAPEAEIATPAPGKPIMVRNSQAIVDQRVWLFRDSFSSALSPYIHAIFRETIHFAASDLGQSLELEPPDIVIFEVVERYL